MWKSLINIIKVISADIYDYIKYHEYTRKKKDWHNRTSLFEKCEMCFMEDKCLFQATEDIQEAYYSIHTYLKILETLDKITIYRFINKCKEMYDKQSFPVCRYNKKVYEISMEYFSNPLITETLSEYIKYKYKTDAKAGDSKVIINTYVNAMFKKLVYERYLYGIGKKEFNEASCVIEREFSFLYEKIEPTIRYEISKLDDKLLDY